MKASVYALAAGIAAWATLAQARPVVLEEAATLTTPDPAWRIGTFGVAIDGDFALVSAERADDASEDNGIQPEGTAFLYRRSGSSWLYHSQLPPQEPLRADRPPGLAMKDGIAVIKTGNTWVYELRGGNWEWVSYYDVDAQGPDIEVSNGNALVPDLNCAYRSWVAASNGTMWVTQATLALSPSTCGIPQPAAYGDIEGNRAVMVRPDDGAGPAYAQLWRRDGSGGSWLQFRRLENNSIDTLLGPEVAMSGPYVALTGRRERGTSIAYMPDDDAGEWAHTGLRAVDSYLEPRVQSATAIERAGPARFAQRNYSFDRGAHVVNVFRVNVDPTHTSTHLATLQTRNGRSVGEWLDVSGSHVIVSGWSANGDGEDVVRIFELPADYYTPAVQVHDFEATSAGAVWQPSAGSAFSVVRSGSNGVYRQSSTAGDAAAWLPSSDATNQAVQAEVTLRSVNGADRWAGLVTRRADDANYYYVTLRASGTVQLRRMVNGAFTTLASAPASVSLNRRYRLRLESIASTHRVYLDDRLVLTARDAALREGMAGIAMYRASADFDNVIVSPSPLTSILRDDYSAYDSTLWHQINGTWRATGGVYRQSNSTSYGRAFTGTPTTDQVVQARIRPTSFQVDGAWVGLLARYQDDRNYLYVSLVGRGRVSIWRRTNAVITQLANRAVTVTPGTWYDLRAEIVGGITRVYLDNELVLSTNADPGPAVPSGTTAKGQVGLITYRATADFDDFRAWQP